MTKDDLKPCPFCGNKPYVFKSSAGVAVGCALTEKRCTNHVRTSTYATANTAFFHWNKRMGE